MKEYRNLFFIISPVLAIIITQVSAIFFGKYLNTLVYIPILLIYWTFIVFLVCLYGCQNIKKWLQKPQGHWIWAVLIISMGFMTLPMFIKDMKLLGTASVFIPHIVFFLINPWMEEYYWRGLILDATEKWPLWISLLYSSILFTIYHTAFAWYAVLFRGPFFYLFVFIISIFLGLVYKKTSSLWWGIFAHFLNNVFSLSIPVFLNMVK